MQVHEKENSSLALGAIYIGKVKNIVPAIDAAFVEICKDQIGFLPLKNAQNDTSNAINFYYTFASTISLSCLTLLFLIV